MFKSAATKIAHNTTIPALAGNQDLRPLQDLITAEKAVIISLQKLSADFSKASEALKTWGVGEGEDLGNILSSSTTILTHFTSALSQYAAHGHTIREQLKAIRTREENLDELRRRRRNVASKADSAEKKLQKMGPEHKNLMQQTDQLNRLREEIRGLDVEIMRDEAAIGDFKRSATRTWMGLKFGGLLECCEKGVIVGEYGKLIISQIPEEDTQPGLLRTQYFGHAKTEELVAEAHQCANEVRLSTVPSAPTQPRRVDQQLPQVPGVSEPFTHGIHVPQDSFSSSAQPPFESHITDSPRRDFLPEPQGLGTGRFLDPTNEAQQQPQYSGSLSSASAFQSGSGFGRRADEFGSTQREGPIDDSNPGGGRFATFPVKGRSGSMGATDNVGAGVGGGVGVGGGGYPPHSEEKNQFSLLSSPPQRQESDSFSSSVAKALAASSDRAPRDEAPLPAIGNPGRLSKDGPAPAYESPVDNENPWVATKQSSPAHNRNISNLSNLSQDEGGLAYISRGGDDRMDDKHVSRHVRFGEVSQINDAPLSPMTPQDDSALPSPMAGGPSMAGQQSQGQNQDQARHGPFDDRGDTRGARVPAPTMNREDQERALDAAAAREIALELHSPSHSQLSFNETQPPAPVGQRDLSASPLSPPAVSYTSSDRKSVSPRPEYDVPVVAAPPEPGLGRAPTYTEHPTISVQQYDQSANPVPLVSPPSQYGTPLSYSSQTPSQQAPEAYGAFSSYEQEYNPYEERRNQGYPGIGVGGEVEGGERGGYNANPPPFDAQPPNAPYMRSATGKRGSTSSLTGSIGSPGGGGKISAAAFKRPSPRPGPGAAFGPPSPTARFGGSTSPSIGGGGGGGIVDIERLPSPYEDDQVPPPSPYGQGQGQMQPLHIRKRGEEEGDPRRHDGYGYDDAQEAYYTEQQRAAGANVAGGGWVGAGPGGGPMGPGGRGRGGGGQGGYGQGRFATNLEDGLM